MSTTSMSSRAMTSRQSVAASAQPHFSAAAVTAAAIAADDDGHRGLRGKVEEAGRDAPPLRVCGAHEAVADHGDAKVLGHWYSVGGSGRKEKT